MKLPFETDKILHFLAGYSVAMTVEEYGIEYAIGAATAAGVIKEWPIDKYTGGTVDAMDALATILGGITAVVTKTVLRMVV